MNLIEPQVRAQNGGGLGELGVQHRLAVILHFLHSPVDLPVARVPVSPFRSDDHLIGAYSPAIDPPAQKLLGQAVGAGSVEVANSGRERAIQHAGAVRLHRFDGPALGKIFAMAEVDVRRPAERGEPKAQAGHRWALWPELTLFQFSGSALSHTQRFT